MLLDVLAAVELEDEDDVSEAAVELELELCELAEDAELKETAVELELDCELFEEEDDVNESAVEDELDVNEARVELLELEVNDCAVELDEELWLDLLLAEDALLGCAAVELDEELTLAAVELELDEENDAALDDDPSVKSLQVNPPSLTTISS